jgi:hypothetical protein
VQYARLCAGVTLIFRHLAGYSATGAKARGYL